MPGTSQSPSSFSTSYRERDVMVREIVLMKLPRQALPRVPHKISYPPEQEKCVDASFPEAARSRRGRVVDLHLYGGKGGENLTNGEDFSCRNAVWCYECVPGAARAGEDQSRDLLHSHRYAGNCGRADYPLRCLEPCRCFASD